MTSRVPGRTLGSLLAVGACALSLAGAGGCFFSPRDPQVAVPFDSLTTRWRQPNEPATLVQNVKVTFEDQQITFYERSFRPEFRFIPDPQDSIEFAQQQQFPYEDYGVVQEKRVAETIFSDTEVDRIIVSYDSIRIQEMGTHPALGDTARWRIDYHLLLVDSVSLDMGDTTRHAGTLQFLMRYLDGEWRLYEWADVRSGDEPDLRTWGWLRGENVN